MDLAGQLSSTAGVFILSENTLWGEDMYDSSYSFQLDPSSNQMATAIRWGAVDTGSLQTVGVLPFSPTAVHPKGADGAMVVTACVQEVLAAIAASLEEGSDSGFGSGYPWKGVVGWANKLDPNVLVVAVGLVITALSLRGYNFTYHNDKKKDVTDIYFGPKKQTDVGVGGGVPPKVKADWEYAVAQAKQYGAIDKGVFVK